MSTPEIALLMIGPFLQYEETFNICQISSILETSRPIKSGRNHSFTTIATASYLNVKVAHPNPYKPGSEVSIRTTTRLNSAGFVQIALTSLIFTVIISSSIFIYDFTAPFVSPLIKYFCIHTNKIINGTLANKAPAIISFHLTC